jgi:hypothetical protein
MEEYQATFQVAFQEEYQEDSRCSTVIQMRKLTVSSRWSPLTLGMGATQTSPQTNGLPFCIAPLCRFDHPNHIPPIFRCDCKRDVVC